MLPIINLTDRQEKIKMHGITIQAMYVVAVGSLSVPAKCQLVNELKIQPTIKPKLIAFKPHLRLLSRYYTLVNNTIDKNMYDKIELYKRFAI